MKLSRYTGDLYAVCHHCKHQHLIPRADAPNPQAWLDWLAKHDGHRTELVTSLDLAQRRLEARRGWAQALLTGIIAKALRGLPEDLLASISPLGYADNADVKEAFAASVTYTLTGTSLASSATLIVGRESTWISNATNKYLDLLVAGKTMTSGTVNSTAGTQIEVHAVGPQDDTPTYPDAFTGSDAGVTLTAADAASIKTNFCKPVAVMGIAVVTQGTSHPFGPVGLRQLFGDGLPTTHGLFLTHNAGTGLHATAGNHVFKNTPVYNTVI